MSAIMTISWVALGVRILLYLADSKYEFGKDSGNFSRIRAFITVIITVISLPASLAFVLLVPMMLLLFFVMLLDSCGFVQNHGSGGAEDPTHENYDGCNYSGIGC
jgi:hypothetical protein